MMKKQLMLADIIDRDTLQQLQDNITKAADISAILLDSEGEYITKLGNTKGICSLIEDTHEPDGACRNYHRQLWRMARETRKPASMTCPISGIAGASVPIFLDDTFLGAWVIGRVRFQDQPAEIFAETAHKAGIDKAKAWEAVEETPVIHRSEFDIIVNFMSIVTDEIVKLTMSNMEIIEKNEQLSILSAKLNQMAYFDKTLQIPNAERMHQDMKAGGLHEALVAVAFADLHRINNLFGRACGDALLGAARDFLLEMDIPDSTVYRGQVSNLCVLFGGTGGDPDLPRRTAEKIYNRCKKAWEVSIGERRQHIFATAHVCVFPLHGYHENLTSYLSSAMEHGIEIARGTNGVVVYDDEARERFHAGLQLELSLKNAVGNGMRGFSLAYQPIVDTRAAIWKGIEALCRWNSPEFGNVPPSVFIPMLEANGLIGAVGQWVLEQSVMQVKAWGLDAVEGFLLEVNLSPIQLTTPHLDRIIIELLETHSYPPGKLGLEVTESSELNFSKHTMEAIVRLSEIGVVIVLDDFGTGYSSFNSLHKLPVKILKTDRTFITGMESDDHKRKLLCAMVSLAHGSGMRFVAEGVESYSQAQFLLTQGADFFQGYFFSRPLTAAQLAEKLDNFHYPVEQLVSMRYPK
ncbi:MAG: EAL domain-containing protein [Oscillospiraceae bacterium]|jgi:EAL domain-containing protein (putative c-di-GMP-specific phosphodiesterase class I)/ligand-binding sensor protein/GGDEF domain-containing protein|nr:EAL domain-containing protein [Oscillospiraceae bacterium]